MVVAMIQSFLRRVRYSASRHKIISALSVVVILIFVIYKVFIGSRTEYIYDWSDGKGTKGYGIIRGGTGVVSYQKSHRLGGLPPSARRSYEDLDPVIYDEYDVDQFEAERYEDYTEKNQIIIILGANIEGGVNKWKGPNEWSIERSSIVNKRHYASLHGYDLIVKDYTKAKKYSNEFREGWQKFDLIKDAFKEYKNGDWFWYIDLYTLIMEPQISLEDLIFKHLNETITRNLEYFNPNELELERPFTNYQEPVNLVLSQDCGGFNLQSFFIKKTQWSSALIDVLFDPVVYLKNHGNWKHDEKSALEYYYDTYAWVRSRFGFVSTRLINSLPKGACPDYAGDETFFYNETQRDFLVNMMGCEYNRNCWDEMEFFKDLSQELHKSWWKKLIG